MKSGKNILNRVRKVATDITEWIIISFIFAAITSEKCYASGFSGEEANVGSILQTLALCGGAVGLAWSGIEYAWGDEQKSARAKARMILIIIATAAVFALPAVIRTAQELFQTGAWSPDHLTTK